MYKNRLLQLLHMGSALLTASFLTACSQEDLSGGNALPEGRYPLAIASVTTSATLDTPPQTRVAENYDGMSSAWEWDGTEKIGVRIGSGSAGTYALNENQKIVAETPCYWVTAAPAQSVKAWYPADNGGNTPVSLADQSNGLAYVLRGSGTGNHTDAVDLNFTHALAKVRVVLKGENKEAVNTVKIKSLTSCTNTQGSISADGASEGWITMMECKRDGETCWEANVVPDQVITDFQVNETSGTLTQSISPLAAKVNTITLTVEKASLKPVDGKFTINAGDDVLIKDYNGTAPIVVNGDATIEIENVQLSPEGTVMTINNGATVTMKVKGNNNSFVSTNGSGIALDNNASIYIEGDNASQSALVVKASETVENGFNIGIGAKDGNISINAITIKNISLDVTGGKQHSAYGSGSAAIGLNSLHPGSGGYVQKCTQISIANSTIKATSDGGACIGLGVIMAGQTGGGYAEIETIQVENSTIQGTSSGNNYGDPGGACVGTGAIVNDKATGKIGRINITSTTFNNGSIGGFTVGRGGVASTGSANSFTMDKGIFVDGQNKGTVGWNP